MADGYKEMEDDEDTGDESEGDMEPPVQVPTL